MFLHTLVTTNLHFDHAVVLIFCDNQTVVFFMILFVTLRYLVLL